MSEANFSYKVSRSRFTFLLRKHLITFVFQMILELFRAALTVCITLFTSTRKDYLANKTNYYLARKCLRYELLHNSSLIIFNSKHEYIYILLESVHNKIPTLRSIDAVFSTINKSCYIIFKKQVLIGTQKISCS